MKLRRSKRSLVVKIPAADWTTDWDGNFTFISPSAERILGYTPEEMREEHPLERTATKVHPDDAKKVKEALRAVYREGGYLDTEFRYRSKDGKWVWVNARAVRTYEIDGTRFLDGLITDISERKRREEALRESEGRYRSLVANIADVDWTADWDGNFTFVSHNAERILGYTQEEMQGVNPLERTARWVHPDDAESVREALRAVYRKGGCLDTEFRLRKKDEQWAWVNARAVRTYERDGTRFLDGLLTDISERKQKEEALRESEGRYRSLVANISDVDWTVDWDGNFTFVSPNAERILGYTQEEMQGVNPLERTVRWVHPDDGERVREALRAVYREGGYLDTEFRYRKKDGEWVWVNARAIKTYEKEGTRFLDGLLSDISERKRGEDELRVLSHRLVESQEAERKAIARELHDEMAQSLTALKLMLERAMRASHDESCSIIGEARVALQDLMGRMRTRSFELWPRALDELGLLHALLLHIDRYAAQNHVTVNFEHFDLQKDLPPQVSLASYRIIQEALTNVARHAGVTEVLVRAWTDDQSIYILVEDQGVGFVPELLTVMNCSGIRGMRERAVSLGGILSIDSAPGQGTSVTAQLPLKPQPLKSHLEEQR
ncbi:MAG: PAS domain S-box protein [Dehalococcoidia bacterium]|nr:PAS domain S-box protein [Dehalococcoidia bacterium]